MNTCTVTNRTDYKSRNAIRKALTQKEKNIKVKVIVTGCYSQRNYNEIMELGSIDLIVDNNSKGKILGCINQVDALNFRDILETPEFEELSTTSMIDRTRAYIKVQDGCDYYCAYCAVPYARGHSRSRKKENVLKQIQKLTEEGYKEFVLGGINLGLYGREQNDNYFLSHLLTDIEKIEGVKLIRLSSIEPQLFSDDLLNFFRKSKKICPHFHIPLQIGCDEMLSHMGRKYTMSDFNSTIQSIRSIFPDAAIGIDVIAGLPGEIEELYQKTLDYLVSLDFTYLHVFPYSRRPGTRAEKMSGQVHGSDIKRRTKLLTKLSAKKTQEYVNFIVKNNIRLKGVIENKSNGFWTALSDHYVRVFLKSKTELEKKYLHLKIRRSRGKNR
jgi:threonylcarbamoyladenosine tRNA methylthiotransferase MtaB